MKKLENELLRTNKRNRNGNGKKRIGKSVATLVVLTPLFWAMLVQVQGSRAYATTSSWQDITKNGGSFLDPSGIAVDSKGDVFVTNLANFTTNEVEELPSGSSMWKDITYGGAFNGPGGIAVDSTGDLFVASTNNNTILELPSGSSKWKDITDGGSFSFPTGIGVDSKGNVFVTNGYDPNQLMPGMSPPPFMEELPSGSSTWQDITYGGTFNDPNSIAVDSAGDVFVTNGNYGTIKELPSGSSTWQDITYGSSFPALHGVAVDSAGDVFVTDAYINNVMELPNGSSTWQSNSYGGSFNSPWAIAVDSTGDMFVTNYSNSTTNAVEEHVSLSAPTAPTGLGHNNVTQTGWTESWSPVSGATGYNVYIGGTKVNSTPVTGTSYNVIGESASTTYKVTVTAVNTGGESSPSTADSVTTLPNAPGVPTGLIHNSVTQTGWTESWSPVSGASSYNVYIGGTKVNSTPVTGTSYNVIGESANTTYHITVTAVNTGGEGSPSAVDSVTTLYNTTGIPTGLHHSGVTTTGWQETWTPVTGTNVGTVTYAVYLNGNQVGTTSSTSYSFTGLSSGTTYTVTIASVNGSHQVSGQSNPDQVTTGVPLSVGTNWAWNGQYGVSYNALQLEAVSGNGPYTWSVIQGALPRGMKLSSDGVISGTPTGPSISSTFTVQVTDADGQTASKPLSIQVWGAPPLTIQSTSLPVGKMGQTYSAQLLANGGQPFQWSLVSGTLPKGVSLRPDGLLSGLPTESGNFTLTVQVSDGAGNPVQETLQLDIQPLPAGEALLNFNGHIQTIPVVITSGTAYLPIWYLMQKLNTASIQDYWLGHDWYLNNTTQPYLYFLQPGLGNTSIYLNGVLVQNVTPESVIDPSTSRLTTCLPFWSLKDLLSRIGYQTSWDGTTWTVTN